MLIFTWDRFSITNSAQLGYIFYLDNYFVWMENTLTTQLTLSPFISICATLIPYNGMRLKKSTRITQPLSNYYLCIFKQKNMFLKKIDADFNEVLEHHGIEKAYPLQKKTIGRIKSGNDVVCVAPKNSGKTMAIVAATVQVLKHAVDDVPRALIIVNDTDTALELAETFEAFTKHTDLRINLVTKKGKFEDVRDKVYFGSDVVIGIPSRLDELYKFNGINLTALKLFIMDDADEFMKFQALSQVYRLSESVHKAQHILFTEKINEGIERFIEKRMQIVEIDDYTDVNSLT